MWCDVIVNTNLMCVFEMRKFFINIPFECGDVNDLKTSCFISMLKTSQPLTKRFVIFHPANFPLAFSETYVLEPTWNFPLILINHFIFPLSRRFRFGHFECAAKCKTSSASRKMNPFPCLREFRIHFSVFVFFLIIFDANRCVLYTGKCSPHSTTLANNI